MKETTVKLKKLINKDDQFGFDICAATRCTNQSTVIVSTEDKPFSLCDPHWEIYCAAEEDVSI